ncbi:MAG: FG-GAP-like repeat-containing protein, partial [Bacteroidia bacterium]
LNGENGSTAKSIPVYTTALQTEPILTDVNNDGVLDIIVANYHNTTNTYSIHCIDYTSTNPIWTNTMTETSIFHAYHGGAIADIDKDGKMEYVIGAKNGLIRALNVEDGSVLWSVSNPGSGCMGAVTIADINSDDTLDVIYHREGTNSGIEILNGFNGNIMWAHTISIGGSFRGSAISDLNGNGKLDLISTHYMGSAHAIEPFTGTLWTVNTQSFFPTYPSLVPYITADNAPIISDFDGDGSLDVFFAMGYGSYTISPNSVGMAFMLKGGVGTCPEWLMFRKDNRRTGYLSTAEVNAQCNTTDISNNSMYNEDIYLYPQPCLDKVEIHSNSPDFIVKQITVHDIQGKEIQLVSDLTNSITNHFTLNTQKLNPGLYFVTLKDGIKTKQLKLIKVN